MRAGDFLPEFYASEREALEKQEQEAAMSFEAKMALFVQEHNAFIKQQEQNGRHS